MALPSRPLPAPFGPTASFLTAFVALTAACGGEAEAQTIQIPAVEPASPPNDKEATQPASAAQALPAATGTASLLGCWNIVVDLPIGTKRGELCFEADDAGELSARLFSKGEWRAAKAVQAKPGHVEVVLNAPIGQATIIADYTESAMTGSLQGSLGRRPFEATRKSD